MSIDFVNANGGQGEVAQRLMNMPLEIGAMRPYMNTNQKSSNYGKPCVTVFMGGDALKKENYQSILATNATLRRDEWKELDAALLPIARSRLNGVQSLIDKGLTYKLGNAMGTTSLEWHDISDAFEAELTMDGIPKSKGDRPVFTTNYLPIPIIHVDYEINLRTLESSRKLGNPLDTTSAQYAARKVAEKLESMLFTSTSTKFGGGFIYSYLSHPDRNQVTLANKWDNSGVTGATIVANCITLKKTAIAAKHFGPYELYIPTDFETVLDADYDSTTPGTTIRERILKISNIDSIKVVDTLTEDNVLLVQMTSDVVRLVDGMPISNVQWDEAGKFVNKYKVMAIQVPQVRADQSGNSGVTHATFTA